MNMKNEHTVYLTQGKKVIANTNKETYHSNAQNNYAYRGILALGRNMGLDNTIT